MNSALYNLIHVIFCIQESILLKTNLNCLFFDNTSYVAALNCQRQCCSTCRVRSRNWCYNTYLTYRSLMSYISIQLIRGYKSSHNSNCIFEYTDIFRINFFTFDQKEIELPLNSRLSVYMNISYQNIDVIIRNLR